jgi:hypothetical protein
MKILLTIITFVFMLDMLTAQTIIQVPADQPTIQAGVDAAGNGDTVLVSDGTYTGDGNTVISLRGKEVVVKSQNGPDNCILDGEGTGYFGFADGVSYEGLNAGIEGFTIRNCMGSGFYYYGGACPDINGNVIELCSTGILVSGGAHVIENNTIQDNTGSGIEANFYTGQISSNIIRGNSTTGAGGGVSLYKSEAIIINNIISGNYARNAGGGIYANKDTSYFINNTIINNSSRKGSGINIDESNPTMVNNIIAYSELHLAPEDDKLKDDDAVITYRYSGGVISGATINTSFINMGAACDVTVDVAGVEITQTVHAQPYERYSLTISCSIGGTRNVQTIVNTETDTLEINVSSPELNLTPTNFSLASGGIDAFPCGLFASESEVKILKHSVFYGNEGGGYFTGNDEDGYTEVVLSGVDGNVISDPMLNKNTNLPLTGSPCIDMGTSDISGIELPETDVYGNERILDGDDNGSFIIDIGACEYDNTSGVKKNRKIITTFELYQNYPNPFNPFTTIEFFLPYAGDVKLQVFNSMGEQVATLVSGKLPVGRHLRKWNIGNKTSGLYFYKLQSNGFSETRKMLVLK